MNPNSWKGRQQALVKRLGELLNLPCTVSISHVVREANGSANWLARRDLGLPLGYHDFGHLTAILTQLLYSDYVGLCSPIVANYPAMN